jgi:hypothetical protein
MEIMKKIPKTLFAVNIEGPKLESWLLTLVIVLGLGLVFQQIFAKPYNSYYSLILFLGYLFFVSFPPKKLSSAFFKTMVLGLLLICSLYYPEPNTPKLNGYKVCYSKLLGPLPFLCPDI